MKLTFDVHIERDPVDPSTYGMDTYKGTVSLDGVEVYSTLVMDPHGPTAARDMKHEVAQSFAAYLANVLPKHDHGV